ncbi:MAG: AraC family transcriptional regulator [Burkholderiales bacterium]|nr:AraC family transcriptional regulator [Burkholderiales bacterium]
MTSPPAPAIDRLSTLLERFRVRARLFHAGPLCGVSHFALQPGQGFLHVLQRGELVVTHGARSGAPRRITLREPSLLFYARPLAHSFHNPPVEGADFNCATVEFEGGAQHPLVRALPPLVVLPLARVPALAPTLDLLFAETEALCCGSRLLADRLFEVLLLQLLRWLLDHGDEAGVSTGLLNGLAHPALARALTALHERPGDPWSVAAMAQCAGMSRSAFAAAFRDTVGQAPADYLVGWRLSLAQARLREGAPLKLIALELGYGSASALSRVFSQRLGSAPRDWLRTLPAQG